MTANPEKLRCVSIVLCDEVYRDRDSNKMVVVGVFNTIWTPFVPVRHPALSLLFTVTDGKGAYDLSVEIEHEQSGLSVWKMGGPFDVTDPLQVADIHLKILSLEFAAAGKYWISVKSGEEILQQRPFYVKLIDPAGLSHEHQPIHPKQRH